MNRRDIPNLITLFRFLLVVPVVLLLVWGHHAGALLCFALAGLSDGLDGYLAKRYGWTSRVGAVLDPLADKLLLVATYVTLAWLGALPAWLVVLVLLRDVVIVVGATLYNALIERLQPEPTPLSKLNTLAQIILALAVLVDLGVWSLPEGVVTVLIAAVLATTVASGVQYVLVWSLKALRHRHGHG